MEKWTSHIQKYRIPLIEQIKRHVELEGIGLEVGSGTSWFSIEVSKSPNISHITCIEIDSNKINLAKTFFLPYFDGKKEKLTYINRDFHSLPLGSETVDFILCDACLHHTENLPGLLSELNRVLKPGGKLIAIREPILPSLPILKQFKALTFGWKQKRDGDIEKTYTLKQWDNAFSNSGFVLNTFQYNLTSDFKEKLLSNIKSLNGILFNRRFFIANK